MIRFVKMLSVAAAMLSLSGMTAAPAGQFFQETPCGFAIGGVSSHGLTLVNDGTLVYDANQGLCWLSDANLAGNPFIRAIVPLSPINPDGVTTPLINPDGTMDYQTALNWVDSLNSFNGGNGWLNHHDWQLPTTQNTDVTCSSHNGGNFGALCTGSALGNLYNTGLAISYPNSVMPRFLSVVPPFINLQPGIYWTGTVAPDNTGIGTFSFNTGDDGANTTNYNFLHVLPMTHDVLGTVAPGGPSCSVRPYISGPGAGKAVYDSCTGLSWPLDANLPAHQAFGFNASVTLTSHINGMNVTVPMINRDGAVFFGAISDTTATTPCPTASTPCPPGTDNWIVAMNNANFGGSANWVLPAGPETGQAGDLDTLFVDLGLPSGDVRLEAFGLIGPFWNLQPGFYWTCERDDTSPANPQGPCDQSLMPGQNCPTAPHCAPFEYSFNFDDGFEGTDHPDKHFYVAVYYPAPARR